MTFRNTYLSILVAGLIGISLLPSSLVAQNTPIPTTTLITDTPTSVTSTPATVININITPTALIDQKIEALSGRVQNLEDSKTPAWIQALPNVDEVLWILLAAFVIWSLRSPVYTLANSIANNANKAKIKIGDIEWSVSDLSGVIVEREILKTGILVATIDKDITGKEREYLERISLAMNSNLDYLTDDGKKRVLLEAINVASADDRIQSEEYIAIKQRALKFGVSISDLDEIIIEMCAFGHTTPPPQLLSQVLQRKREFQQPT